MTANGTNGTVDLRGEFIRGWDNGRGADPGRALASWQMDAFKSHNHQTGIAEEYGWARYGYADYWSYLRNGHFASGGYDTFTSSTGGPETRPRNLALLSCMKL